MTNQVFDKKVSGTPGLMGEDHSVVRALVVLLALILLVTAVNIGNGRLAIGAASDKATIGTINNIESAPFSTQQYWDMAKAREAAGSAAAVPAEGPAYFTETYWNLAKAAPIAERESFSTQQYWDMAKAREAAGSGTAAPAEGPAYFTETYWNLAKRAEKANQPAYFTEQYWILSGERE